MDIPGIASEHVGRPNTHRHATFDSASNAEPPYRAPSEEGTDKAELHEGKTRIKFSEILDNKKSGIKRSSTYPFPSHSGRDATIENVTIQNLPFQSEYERSKVRMQSKSAIPPSQTQRERTSNRSTTFSKSLPYKGGARSYRRSRSTTLRGASRSRRIHLDDDSVLEDLDSDILSSDEDSASDEIGGSSLAFDFSSIAPHTATKEDAKTVSEAPAPSIPAKKRSESYNKTIHKILVSHYNSSTSRRSDSTAELLVGQPVEAQDNQSEHLMRWMYVLSPIRLRESC